MVDRFPLAYLITIRCYGTWLHGDIRGSTTRFVNRFEMPHLGYSPELLVESSDRMKQSPYLMNAARRRIVLAAMVEVCQVKKWKLHAVLSARSMRMQ
jgi:hypothetical protein